MGDPVSHRELTSERRPLPDDATFFYSVFGLVLECNREIKSLESIAQTERPDVRVCFGHSPSLGFEINQRPIYVSEYVDPHGKPGLQVWGSETGDYLRMQYFEGVQFWLDRNGTNIWVLSPSDSPIEDALSYLVGPVLGILLRLRGTICLHASAIVFRDEVIAFAGGEGAGKSTTAVKFAAHGHRVVTDDIVAVTERQGRFHVLPGYKHLCLWPDTVESLYGIADTLPRLAPNWEKRSLAEGKFKTHFETAVLPLGLIYVFGDRGSGQIPQIEPLPPRLAFLALAANTFATAILDKMSRVEEFRAVGRIATTLPVRRVRLGPNNLSLDTIYDVLCADLLAAPDPPAQRVTYARSESDM